MFPWKRRRLGQERIGGRCDKREEHLSEELEEGDGKGGKNKASSLALVHKHRPITSVSLASLLTKVFIGLRSVNYRPISCSHSGTAAVVHSVKSVHLANPDTFVFAALSTLKLVKG